MMTLVALASIVVLGLVPLLAGGIVRRAPAESIFGIAFLLGSGIVTISMLLISLVGVNWSSLSTALVVAVLIVLCSLWFRMSSDQERSARPLWSIRSVPLDLAVIVLAVLNLIWVTDTAPREWDYWAEWGLKARIFIEAGWTIDWSFLQSPDHAYVHPDYPPLVPLLFDYVALWYGQWSERWLGLIDWLMALSLLSVVRGFARERVGAFGASLVTLLIASSVLPQKTGMADVTLVAFAAAGLIVLGSHVVTGARWSATIGLLFLGLAALTKNEGLVFLLVGMTVLFILSSERKRLVLPAIVALIIPAAWQIARVAHGLSGDLSGRGAFARMADRLATVGEWIPYMLSQSVILPSIVLVLALVIVLRYPLPRAVWMILIPALLQILAYLLVYMMTPHEVHWHIQWSWSRIEAHAAVPLLYVVATSIVSGIVGSRELVESS